jgi:uncharacterized sulfatase
MNRIKLGILLLAFGQIFIPAFAINATKRTFTEVVDSGESQETGTKKKDLRSRHKVPNIIFYLSDDQDKLDYGCYGNDLIQTPAVDRLAREGMVFENAFTGQAICAPSRSQLYSGKYPLKNGCFLNHVQVKNDVKSVTKYMRELGYEVILAGKSHVRPSTIFDWDKAWEPVDKEGAPRPYIPLDSIKNYFEKADKPFCMFITSEFPHGPYYDVEGKISTDFKFYPFESDEKDNSGAVKRKAGYYRSVLEENAQLAKVLTWVDNYLEKNTLFIYSADHGVSGKYTVYDRGLNVPFVVRWPGVVKPGSRSGVMIHYTDVLPTFMNIAGGSIPENMDGKSFRQALKGDKSEIHEYVYGVQTNQNILNATIFPSRMIRSNKYKYIRNFNSVEVMEQNFGKNKYINAFIKIGAMKFKSTPFEELYDIVYDPFEQNNLAKKPEFKEIKEKLAKDMFVWMKGQGDIFSDTIGYMPILPAEFKLDKPSNYNRVPDTLINTLKKEDYLYIKHLSK